MCTQRRRQELGRTANFRPINIPVAAFIPLGPRRTTQKIINFRSQRRMNLSPDKHGQNRRILHPVPCQSPPSFLIHLTQLTHTVPEKWRQADTKKRRVQCPWTARVGWQRKQAKETKSSQIQKLSSSYIPLSPVLLDLHRQQTRVGILSLRDVVDPARSRPELARIQRR